MNTTQNQKINSSSVIFLFRFTSPPLLISLSLIISLLLSFVQGDPCSPPHHQNNCGYPLWVYAVIHNPFREGGNAARFSKSKHPPHRPPLRCALALCFLFLVSLFSGSPLFRPVNRVVREGASTQPPLYRGKLFACGTGLEPVGRFAFYCPHTPPGRALQRTGSFQCRTASRGLTTPTDGNIGRWSHTPESGNCGQLQIDFDPSDGGHPQPTGHQTLQPGICPLVGHFVGGGTTAVITGCTGSRFRFRGTYTITDRRRRSAGLLYSRFGCMAAPDRDGWPV